MAKADYNPLSMIPSAHVVRSRLEQARTICRKLEILLETAERIEAEDRRDKQPDFSQYVATKKNGKSL